MYCSQSFGDYQRVVDNACSGGCFVSFQIIRNCLHFGDFNEVSRYVSQRALQRRCERMCTDDVIPVFPLTYPMSYSTVMLPRAMLQKHVMSIQGFAPFDIADRKSTQNNSIRCLEIVAFPHPFLFLKWVKHWLSLCQ